VPDSFLNHLLNPSSGFTRRFFVMNRLGAVFTISWWEGRTVLFVCTSRLTFPWQWISWTSPHLGGNRTPFTHPIFSNYRNGFLFFVTVVPCGCLRFFHISNYAFLRDSRFGSLGVERPSAPVLGSFRALGGCGPFDPSALPTVHPVGCLDLSLSKRLVPYSFFFEPGVIGV